MHATRLPLASLTQCILHAVTPLVGLLMLRAQEDSDDDEDEDRVGSIFQKAKAIGAQQGTADDLPTENAFRGQGRTLAGGSGASQQVTMQRRPV